MGWMWAGIDYGENKAAADAARAVDAQGTRWTTGGASGEPIYTGGSFSSSGASGSGGSIASGASGSGYPAPASAPNRFENLLSDAEGRLKRLLDDPNSIGQSAAYKFRVGQGEEALQRSLGAKGMLNSGNRLMDLTKYGQDMASQEYDNQFGRLKDLLGIGATGYIGDRQASNQAQDISNRFKLGSDANSLNQAQFAKSTAPTVSTRSIGISNPWALPGYNGYNY